MPQPLSRVTPDGHLSLGAKLICKDHPDLVVKVAHCIALSSHIENLMSGILASMLGTHAKPAAAMLGSLQSLGVKRIAIKAAAEEALTDPDDRDLFTAVLDECDTACKHRHRFVHWAWARLATYHGQKPLKALFFIDPKTLLAHEADAQGFLHPNEGRGLFDDIDRSGVLVYRESDLDAAVRETEAAHDHLSAVRMLTIKGGQKHSVFEPLRQRLSAAPEIARRLAKLRALRKSDPAE
jgi:hypothetical protein